jgi:hypothetical protein
MSVFNLSHCNVLGHTIYYVYGIMLGPKDGLQKHDLLRWFCGDTMMKWAPATDFKVGSTVITSVSLSLSLSVSLSLSLSPVRFHVCFHGYFHYVYFFMLMFIGVQ